MTGAAEPRCRGASTCGMADDAWHDDGMDADVIVVGAGLSGLVATAELADAEKSVILLDGEPLQSLGGQAHWSFGGLFLVVTRTAAAPHPRLGGAGPGRLAGQCSVRPPRGLLAATLGRGLRRLRRGRETVLAARLGVRFFPLVQWAERGGYTVAGTATPSRASTSPGAPVPAWSSRSPSAC